MVKKMNIWNMAWPIMLVVLANTFYNICTKSAPSDINAFLMMAVTYLVAATVCMATFLIMSSGKIMAELGKLNWTAPVLGVAIIGLEVGYIFVYRARWKVSQGALVANVALAVVLLLVGFLLYKEQITSRQLIGMLVCLAGLALIR